MIDLISPACTIIWSRGPISFKTQPLHDRGMRDSSEWLPTAYRSHTIGQVVTDGGDMVGSQVTLAGYAETVRGRGGVCFAVSYTHLTLPTILLV